MQCKDPEEMMRMLLNQRNNIAKAGAVTMESSKEVAQYYSNAAEKAVGKNPATACIQETANAFAAAEDHFNELANRAD